MPNIPVSSHRALSEKVMTASPLVRDDGGGIDLDQPFRPRQRRHHDAGRDREDALQMLSDRAINRFAIAWISDVDGDLADVLNARAGLLQQRFDVPHRLVGLARGIAYGDACRGVEILPNLPANEDDAAPRNHGLAEIVV